MQPPSPTNSKGVDVSHHQGDIDWKAVKNSGISFAMIKATEGHSFTDPKFEDNVKGARQAGLLVGVYHFFHGESIAKAEQEAAHFLQAVKNYAPFDLPYALDVENNRVDPAAVPVWLQAVRVSDHGRKPFIYSNPDTISHRLKDRNFAEYPLWYAFYRQHEVPANAGAWSQWTMLQYTDRGSVPGITGHVDRNEYNGRLER